MNQIPQTHTCPECGKEYCRSINVKPRCYDCQLLKTRLHREILRRHAPDIDRGKHLFTMTAEELWKLIEDLAGWVEFYENCIVKYTED